MRICVVGAGAIGGMLAARLALAGNEVSLVARGAHLQAIRDAGLVLIGDDGVQQVARPVCATDVPAQAGRQDLVILALKAHQVAGVAAQLRALLEPDTRIVTMQNGIPWWYFHGLDGPWRDRVGFAQTMEQLSGLAWITGHPNDQPRIQRGPCEIDRRELQQPRLFRRRRNRVSARHRAPRR
mgnify:CR=1 FL=1